MGTPWGPMGTPWGPMGAHGAPWGAHGPPFRAEDQVSGKIDPINLKRFFMINPILPLPKPDSPINDKLFETIQYFSLKSL